ILSIESFVEHISGLRYGTPTKLLFSLYEAFLEQEGVEKESFYDFGKWGQMLLQDFNELDRYMVDTEAFFGYLGSIQEIKHWTLDGTSTPMIDKRIRFWKSLKPIYERFRNNLQAEGLGYQGQVYRTAVGKLSEYLNQHGSSQHIFIGFNALNRAEESIIKEILNHGKAQIYWDVDPYYLDDSLHDAGLFLRKHLKTWKFLQNNPLKGASSHFNSPKQIQIIGLPKQVTQAKYCGELLEKIHKKDPSGFNKTALVLGEESLLTPILHSLPDGLESVNVTMGYPLKESPVTHLFEVLFELFTRNTGPAVAIKPLLKLLAHPFLQEWFRQEGFNPSRTAAAWIRENKMYVDNDDFARFSFPVALCDLLSLSPVPGPRDILARFMNLIEKLSLAYQKGQDTVSLEYLYHFHVLFTQLFDLTEQYPFVTEVRSLQMLYDQLLAEERLDLQGEPLEGLQIMGMLESRNLDFESVIITSVNEGILPAGKSNASFIPFDVKKEFGLPTYKEKDAVYTYHFYRLLQRAKTIYLCYNTEPDVLKGGEPSRFIYQLLTDTVISPNVSHSLAAPTVGAAPKSIPHVTKGKTLINLLEKKATAGFSPTSLSQYIEDPLVFYKKYLLGIRETDELEETVAANTFGTVMHEALEVLYRPLKGEILQPAHIVEMRKKAPSLLHKAFQDHYLKGSTARGKNLIALQVMNKYLEMFFDFELKRIRHHSIRILGVEEKRSRELHIPGVNHPVRVKGMVDRIEEVDGSLQIIDYKTGKVEPRHLRIKEWESLHSDPEKSKAFQVLCYSWLLQDQTATYEAGIKAGVFSFKNISAGYQWYGRQSSGKNYNELITSTTQADFRSTLEYLITEIFNPEVPFAKSE
ncbi:MAG: PD-(D/E)XK nuclease family protein, partial [Robiginitalea sp.]